MGKLFFFLAAALTRAKELVIVVAPYGAIDRAVRDVQDDQRQSSLRDRLVAMTAEKKLQLVC
jgi:ATP-dependent exoDNAse (exonuclease V) alpha subunit